MTGYEFHQRDGWYFKRLPNGAVRIRVATDPASPVEHTIPESEWVSILAHLSPIRDGVAAYGLASDLHIAPGVAPTLRSENCPQCGTLTRFGEHFCSLSAIAAHRAARATPKEASE